MGLRLILGLVAALVAVTSFDMSAIADDTGFAYMHSLRRERGRTCMADHWHYGSGASSKSKRSAEREAIRSWQNFTAMEYGSDWARYYRSGSRKMRCGRSSSGWSCDVESRPCK